MHLILELLQYLNDPQKNVTATDFFKDKYQFL